METEKMIEIKHGSENMVDLLNQEQAELQKAMIEEMARDLSDSCDRKLLNKNPFSLTGWGKIAEHLIKKYHKIPYRAVVLSKEDFDKQMQAIENLIINKRSSELEIKIFNDTKEAFENVLYNTEMNLQHITTELDQVRKETAREFVEQAILIYREIMPLQQKGLFIAENAFICGIRELEKQFVVGIEG